MSNSNEEFNMAEIAVTRKLKLDNSDPSENNTFIERHQKTIFDKLEHFYTEEEKDHEFAFIAASLPLISGIIHVGSTVDNYKNATEWIKKEQKMPNADPASVLSALTFIYLVNKGVDEWKTSDSKTRINETVEVINLKISKNEEKNNNLEKIQIDLNELLDPTSKNKEKKELESIFRDHNEENLYEEIVKKFDQKEETWRKMQELVKRILTPSHPQNS